MQTKVRPHWRSPALRFAALAALVAGAGSAIAGGAYTLGGGMIAGGGGRAQAGCFGLSGTIGQPVAGVGAGGSYTLVSGFWAAQSARPDQLLKTGFEGCTR
jgi:hypothetical protein